MKHVKFFVFLCILTFTISCGQQKKYVEYKVKQGETMKDIAQKLDMKTKDLLKLNPDIGRKPAINSVIIIPNKKIEVKDKPVLVKEAVVVSKEKPINNEQIKKIKQKKDSLLYELKKKFVIHNVKPKETIYGLKRFYNVTQDDLLLLNPELSEGLKIGQIIKIKAIEEGEQVKVEKTNLNSIYEDIIEEDASLKMALLLPFRAKEYDSISAKEIFQNSMLANIVTDFYLGVEIAIDSLRKQGIQIDLNVFDTGRNSSKIHTILSSNDLNSNDVVIGPLYSEEAEIVAKTVKTPVVFPLYSKNQSKFSSSKLIKTSPEKKVFRDELATYVKENFTKGNLIVVGDGKIDSNISNILIKKSLESLDSVATINVLKPEKGYIAKSRFLDILKPNVDNWVILTSNDMIIVADAINSLISLPEDTNVKVFTFNKGSAFDKIDNLKLAKVNLTYVSDQYVNEASITTQLFNKQYYKKNNALPSFYATKGFDITYDILIRLASGNTLKESFDKGASYRVESKFDYSNKTNSISGNKGLFIIQYNNDLSLTRLK